MRKRNIFLSVIVPAYNEEDTIQIILKKILSCLPPRSEVIVVDDGSSDKTQEILLSFERYKRIRLFFLPKNRGKGYAVRYGLRKARGSVFLIQDADLEYNPQDYKRLLRPIKNGQAQVVYGSRLANHPLSLSSLRRLPLPHHFIGNKFLTFMTNLLYGSHLTDMETCYKVFSRKVYRTLKLTKDRFDIEVEITAQILRAGFKIIEIPIKTKPRSYDQGKKITWRDGVYALFALLKFRIDTYLLSVFAVIAIAALFRFWDFPNRYGLWSDQARDAIVGRVSIAHRTLPLIGSFSSAGPFTFGPYWYWQSALMNLISPTHMGYWIGMGIASLFMIVLLMWIGEKIGGRFMSILVGLFAAVSFSQLQSSLGSTQHSMVAVIVTLFLAMIILYINSGSILQLFLASFFLGFAMNYHYQAMYLLPMLVLLFFSRRPSLLGLIMACIGLFLPFLPLLIFDIQHDWWNLTRIIDYYRFGQYRIYVPNRWLTYAGIFWPSYWAKTVGGFSILAYSTMISVGFLFLVKFFRRQLKRSLLIYGFGFLAAIIWFRYFRGERFEGYVIYSIPLIIIFTAWLVSQIAKRYLAIGLIVSALLMFGSLRSVWNDRHYRNAYAPLKAMKQSLIESIPASKYAIYDHEFRTSGCSISLSLLLDDRYMAANDGLPIGICQEEFCPPGYEHITSSDVGAFVCRVVDLRDSDNQVLSEQNWVLVSPEEVHRMTVEWWKNEDLTH